MATEGGTYISDLDASKPTSGETPGEGDDHIRLIKDHIKVTFPNITGAVTPTHTELNVLDNLASGKIILGNSSNVAAAVTPSGDVTITDAGVTAIGSGVIVNADISASAAITSTKVALADGKILVGNASGQADAVTMSGDVTILNTGVAAIGTGVIVNADIKSDAAIDATKIANGTVTSAEFQYLASVTSDIQTQLDARVQEAHLVEYDAGDSGTSKTIDFANGVNQKLALTGDVSITLSNPQSGYTHKIKITTHASNTYTVTFSTTVKWPGGTAYSASATGSKVDIVTLYYDGAAWWGQFAKDFA